MISVGMKCLRITRNRGTRLMSFQASREKYSKSSRKLSVYFDEELRVLFLTEKFRPAGRTRFETDIVSLSVEELDKLAKQYLKQNEHPN